MIDSIKIENGKYEIVLDDSYNVHIYRGGKLSVVEPPHPKMLISLIYEVQRLRKQEDFIKQALAQKEQLYGMPENEAVKFRIRKVFSLLEESLEDL